MLEIVKTPWRTTLRLAGVGALDRMIVQYAVAAYGHLLPVGTHDGTALAAAIRQDFCQQERRNAAVVEALERADAAPGVDRCKEGAPWGSGCSPASAL